MAGDFAPVLMAAAEGRLVGASLEWKPGPSVCVVLTSQGYPGEYPTGKQITGVAAAEAAGVTVFQAGTRHLHGHLETSGGRVLGVTASGEDLESAIAAAYAGVSHIQFDGMHYRTDIGAKGIRKTARP